MAHCKVFSDSRDDREKYKNYKNLKTLTELCYLNKIVGLKMRSATFLLKNFC